MKPHQLQMNLRVCRTTLSSVAAVFSLALGSMFHALACKSKTAWVGCEAAVLRGCGHQCFGGGGGGFGKQT
jgi:hypothetical protein